ncbi:trypsin-like peptidase domain-containing protein [candidate division KSB1 bacterium]|nr:trypsin-like peptidase domain-containing protein [candidate division KSB1 bacterium]
MKKSFTMLVIVNIYLFLFVSACNEQSDAEKRALMQDSLAVSESLSSAQPFNAMNVAQITIENSRRNAITRAVEMVSPAVVGINVTQIREYVTQPFIDDPFFRQFFRGYRSRQQVKSLGSGFIISPDGFIITNEHVVSQATEIIVTLPGGEKYQAQIVGSDYPSDIALLKINAENLPYVQFGDSDDVIIGEWAIAFGNPFGLFDVGAEPSVSVGVISAVNRDFDRGTTEGHVYQDMLQTDAAINSGNSGGPLVNSLGEVIGINTFIYSGSDKVGTSIGLGFALPSNRVKRIFNELKLYGKVNRSFWTGLKVDNINRLMARYLGLNSTEGVIIEEIEKNSPASRAQLEEGDVILAINETRIRNVDDIWRIIENRDLKGGDTLKLQVFRRNRTFNVTMKLERLEK